MDGSFEVKIRTKKINYDFVLKRKITILTGDSATGKSTLAQIVNDVSSGMYGSISCRVPCLSLPRPGHDWKNDLKNISKSIIIIDEDFSEMNTPEFNSLIQKSSSYFLLINRNPLECLTYSMDEIYRIKNSGRCNSFVPLYTRGDRNIKEGGHLITEDSNSGNQFFIKRLEGRRTKVISAHGKDNVINVLKSIGEGQRVSLMVDRASFGSSMAKISKELKEQNLIYNILPYESFECMILESPMFIDSIRNEVSYPENNGANRYFSWEQYYTELLQEITKGTMLEYGKKRLRSCFTKDCCCHDIQGKCKFIKYGNKLDMLYPLDLESKSNVPAIGNYFS